MANLSYSYDCDPRNNFKRCSLVLTNEFGGKEVWICEMNGTITISTDREVINHGRGIMSYVPIRSKIDSIDLTILRLINKSAILLPKFIDKNVGPGSQITPYEGFESYSSIYKKDIILNFLDFNGKICKKLTLLGCCVEGAMYSNDSYTREVLIEKIGNKCESYNKMSLRIDHFEYEQI